MTAKLWDFWIDVGGTFTDVLIKNPDGALAADKLLSSGATKGLADSRSNARELFDSARAGDPQNFWNGFRIRLLDAAGNVSAERAVAEFNTQQTRLALDQPLEFSPAGCPYELFSGEPAPLLAIRKALRLQLHEAIPPVSLRLGTTRGTNALLERKGAKTAFVTTRGFGDVLEIGYQTRPQLFKLHIQKPAPLYAQRLEIAERIDAQGNVLTPLDSDQARGELAQAAQAGCRSLAICLLHAWRNPLHENQLAEIAAEFSFEEIALSSRVAPSIKLVPRGDTTVVDAYLNPVIRNYVRQLRDALGAESDLRLMTSAGGLSGPENFSGKDSILSGPAGGVAGSAHAARRAGFERAIGFDMGGTSTDVSRYDGKYEYTFETEKAGVRICAPALDIQTVAAGGGSLCKFDGQKLVVGPESAGADPGPACYGRGGPLALTDVNLILGRVPPEYFPFRLDRPAALRGLEKVAEEIKSATGAEWSAEHVAEGFFRIANANMAKPIREISIAAGFDPREYCLVAFGGAAGQHACALAAELGIKKILLHPHAGVLSAYGLGLAATKVFAERQMLVPLASCSAAELESLAREIEAEARIKLEQEGVSVDQALQISHAAELRYAEQDETLLIPFVKLRGLSDDFTSEHQRLFGYLLHERPIELVRLRVELSTQLAQQEVARAVSHVARIVSPCDAEMNYEMHGLTVRTTKSSELYFAGKLLRVPLYLRAELIAGARIAGAAIVIDPAATIVIEPEWRAEVDAEENLILHKVDEASLPRPGQSVSNDNEAPLPRPDRSITRDDETKMPRLLSSVERDQDETGMPRLLSADPVLLELFNNRFASIAGQMGAMLRRAALSTNVKERLDFSCALFTADGSLVANAPHVPVHLGAMSETVRCILRDNPQLRPGDVYLTNDPYRGGSHLPDVTVINPVHDADGRLIFFTASRAHHAEIGGTVPGSMPPASKSLAEEGVLLRNFKLRDARNVYWDELEKFLRGGTYPSRMPEQNLADVRAQFAANHQGAQLLHELIAQYTEPVTLNYMRHIQDAAAAATRAALGKLQPGVYEFRDRLDDDSSIAVKITIEAADLTIDFTGTAPVSNGNLNANPAIVRAAVLYCLRCLIGREIPLNEGVLKPVQIILPECLLNPPSRDDPAQCAAVAGGNVETSMRIVDAIFGALQTVAASQGTMNNLIFGDERFGYYETICGGAGAGPGFDGASAVHTHMTNTRITDAEILELRYPVRLREFSIRRGSGGAGKFRGGDGVVRELEFLAPLNVAVISERRPPNAPYGLAGGMPGSCGRNILIRADGSTAELPAKFQRAFAIGERLRLETPGGGGYGNWRRV